MRMRYVISHVGRDGNRTLTLGNNGARRHFDDDASATEVLDLLRPGLLRVLSAEAHATLRVERRPCYDHGECIGTVW